MRKQVHQTPLVSLIEQCDSQQELVRHAEDIVRLWTAKNTAAVTLDIMKPAFHHSLNIDLALLSEKERLSTRALRELFLEHWVDITEWRPKSFWKNILGIAQDMVVRIDDVYACLAKKLAPWVFRHQGALERVFFNAAQDSDIGGRSYGTNTVFSILFRELNNNLARENLVLGWSDAFITDLFLNEGFDERQVQWAEYPLLPQHLKFDFAVQCLLDGAYPKGHVNAQWLSRTAETPEQLLRLAGTAATLGHAEALLYVKEHYPQIAKKIEVGEQLELAKEEILELLFVPVQVPGQLPNDISMSE